MIKTIRDLGLAIHQSDTGKIGFRANVDLPLDSEISWYTDTAEAPAFLRKVLEIRFVSGYWKPEPVIPTLEEPAFFRRRNAGAKALGYTLTGGTT